MFLSSSSTESCMYNIRTADGFAKFTSGKETDYFQLGWLVAWVLDSERRDYHEREWDTQSELIRTNQFIKELITNGVYKSELLYYIPKSDTLKHVIEQRQK